MILKIFDRFKVRKVEFFSNFQLSLKYDSFGSAFSFEFYFDPNNPDHKELACVSHYHDCEIEHNGETLVTGFALSQGFTWTPTKQLATISGYSKPGFFEDCSVALESYPLQFNGMSLLNVAKKITRPWNENTKYKIGIKIDDEVRDLVNKSYPSIEVSQTDTIASILTKLAQEKRIIISHDEKGNLLFTQAKTNLNPILNFNFTQGQIPGVEFKHNFNGQGMHSHITVMKQASATSDNATQLTIRNPYVPTVFRPKTVTMSTGDEISVNEFALRELAKEWENLSLSIKLDRWEIDGKIIRPNNMIEIQSPELYIYPKSKFFIREVTFTGNSSETTCTLNCVIPEVVNGKMAKSIFQGINMHP